MVHSLLLRVDIKVFGNLSQEMVDLIMTQLVSSYHQKHVSQCRSFLKLVVVYHLFTCTSVFPMVDRTALTVNFNYQLTVMLESLLLQVPYELVSVSST
jgi:hypothetical protein